MICGVIITPSKLSGQNYMAKMPYTSKTEINALDLFSKKYFRQVRLRHVTKVRFGQVTHAQYALSGTPRDRHATGALGKFFIQSFGRSRLENSKGPESNIQDMKNFLAFPSFFFISLGIKILRTISWNFPIRTYCGYSNFTFLPKSPFIYQITYLSTHI